MTVVRGLYERFRQLVHEAAKFGTVGAVAFLTATIGTNLLHFRAGQGPLISNVIATIAGTFVSFFGNRYWTFRHREGSTVAREYAVFFVLNGIGLGIQLACIGFTYYLLDMHGKLAYNVALIFGIGLGTLVQVLVLPPLGLARAAGGRGRGHGSRRPALADRIPGRRPFSRLAPHVCRGRERAPAGHAPHERERARQS